jgi:hypothetical protein
VKERLTDDERLHRRIEKLTALLESLNDVYDVLGRDEKRQPAGFVHGHRFLTCPDCLTNGFVSRDCSSCNGSGEIRLSKGDPYAKDLPPTTTGVKLDESTGAKRARSQAQLAAAEAKYERAEKVQSGEEAPEDKLLRVVRIASSRPGVYGRLARALDQMKIEVPDLYVGLSKNSYSSLKYLAQMRGIGRLPNV